MRCIVSSLYALRNPRAANVVCYAMPQDDLLKVREKATGRELTAVSATSIPISTGDYSVDKTPTLDFVDEDGNPVEILASDIGGNPDSMYQRV